MKHAGSEAPIGRYMLYGCNAKHFLSHFFSFWLNMFKHPPFYKNKQPPFYRNKNKNMDVMSINTSLSR